MPTAVQSRGADEMRLSTAARSGAGNGRAATASANRASAAEVAGLEVGACTTVAAERTRDSDPGLPSRGLSARNTKRPLLASPSVKNRLPRPCAPPLPPDHVAVGEPGFFREQLWTSAQAP